MLKQAPALVELWELLPGVTWEGHLIYRRPYTDELAHENHDHLVELPPDAEAEIRSRLQ